MASTTDYENAPEDQGQNSQSYAERAKLEVDSARQQFRHTGEAIREEAKDIASAVRHKAMDSIESGKSVITDSLDDFSAAIRKASDELDERNQSSAASLVRHAATGLEQVTEAVKGRSVQDIAGSITQFARERPTAFFIGAALAGIALGRFARAHSPDQHTANDGDYGDYNDY
jgi:gas vesicle protein